MQQGGIHSAKQLRQHLDGPQTVGDGELFVQRRLLEWL
jgi:hypothetical protein